MRKRVRPLTGPNPHEMMVECMPCKNSRKSFLENGYYHLYNRGVEKRTIFLDEHDYKVFLYLLKAYLDPDEKINQKTSLVNPMNLSDEVDLLAFCLMSNHFHLLIHQNKKNGISKIMQRVLTNYVMYFNKRYKRVGPLFQGVYKAVLVESENYLLHVSRYIHRNPLGIYRVSPLPGSDPLVAYPYSSFGDYLGVRSSRWVKPSSILEYFSSNDMPLMKKFKSYKDFVTEKDADAGGWLEGIGIDNDE